MCGAYIEVEYIQSNLFKYGIFFAEEFHKCVKHRGMNSWQKTLLLNQTLRVLLIVLLYGRNSLRVTMIVWFDERNSVMVKMVLWGYDKNLVMVWMVVRLDVETDNGKNDCPVGQKEEQWKGIINTDGWMEVKKARISK